MNRVRVATVAVLLPAFIFAFLASISSVLAQPVRAQVRTVAARDAGSEASAGGERSHKLDDVNWLQVYPPPTIGVASDAGPGVLRTVQFFIPVHETEGERIDASATGVLWSRSPVESRSPAESTGEFPTLEVTAADLQFQPWASKEVQVRAGNLKAGGDYGGSVVFTAAGRAAIEVPVHVLVDPSYDRMGSESSAPANWHWAILCAAYGVVLGWTVRNSSDFRDWLGTYNRWATLVVAFAVLGFFIIPILLDTQIVTKLTGGDWTLLVVGLASGGVAAGKRLGSRPTNNNVNEAGWSREDD